MNQEEYISIVNKISDGLFRYALKLTNDAVTAQDLVQESFMKLWKNRDKIDTNHAKPFLYRVLYNKMVDDYRKNKRVDLGADTMLEGNYSDSQLETKDLIDQAFKHLKEEQKSIILLRDWEGYSYEEIAEILGLSLSAMKVNLFRARKKMKTVLIALQSDIKNKGAL